MSDPSRNGNPANDPGLARLYREAAREEPPAHLDAAILSAAHRDVGARPRPFDSAALRSWRLPVSIAAVVVLSVSIVMLMVEEGGDQFPEPPRSIPKAVPEQRAEVADQASNQASARSQRAGPTPPASAPAAEPSGARETTGEPRLAGKSAVEEAGKQPTPATPAGPAPRPLPSTPPSVASSGQRAAEPKPARQPDSATPRATMRSPQPESARESASSTIGVRGLSEQSPPAPSGRVVPQAAAPAPSVKPAPPPWQSALVQEYEHQPPEKWIEKIAELKRDGKTIEADDMLAEFKKRFPDYPLPSALR